MATQYDAGKTRFACRVTKTRIMFNITGFPQLQPSHDRTAMFGRKRADKIGVGAGGDIVGTDISCIFMARQYMGPTRQSYGDDHRHVGVMSATPSINTPARCAEQVRTRLP